MSDQLNTLPVMKPFGRKLRKQMTAAEVAMVDDKKQTIGWRTFSQTI